MGKEFKNLSNEELCDLMCGIPEDGFDETVYEIDPWYDRHTKLWCIEKLNKDGYQIGDAVWVCGKKDAKRVTKELEDEFNVADERRKKL